MPCPIADCTLAPLLFFFAQRLVAAFGRPPIIGRRPSIAAYWDAIQQVAVVGRVLDERREAIAASPIRALVADPV